MSDFKKINSNKEIIDLVKKREKQEMGTKGYMEATNDIVEYSIDQRLTGLELLRLLEKGGSTNERELAMLREDMEE